MDGGVCRLRSAGSFRGVCALWLCREPRDAVEGGAQNTLPAAHRPTDDAGGTVLSRRAASQAPQAAGWLLFSRLKTKKETTNQDPSDPTSGFSREPLNLQRSICLRHPSTAKELAALDALAASHHPAASDPDLLDAFNGDATLEKRTVGKDSRNRNRLVRLDGPL